MTKNIIALQKGFIIPDNAVLPREKSANRAHAASIQAELMQLGYMLDEKAYEALSSASRDWMVSYYNEIVPFLKQSLGYSRHYRPFYVNFPTQVMEMSNIELFLNAVCHYWSGGTWEPPQELKQRGISFENVEFKKIKLGTDEDFDGIFTRLVSINSSLTPEDKAVVAWFIDNRRDKLKIPEKIPFKETLCILAAKGLNVPIKTPTDVLRVAVYMSGGDVALPGLPPLKPRKQETAQGYQFRYFRYNQEAALKAAREAFKYKNFTRSERKMLLGLLEKTSLDVTEMQGKLGRWLRLGEGLHPGEYGKKFPKTAEAFYRLRNQPKGEKIRTFNSRVDLAFADYWKDGMEVLAERPGEFARRLDWMLRMFEASPVLKMFERIGDKISSKVLFELSTHFERRLDPKNTRSIMLKNSKRSKLKVLDPLPPLPNGLVARVKETILGILGEKIAALPKLGNVWVDERLMDVPLPFAMRSLNTGIKTYIRGTRIPFRGDANVVRSFVHWFDDDASIDIDLSAGFFDAELNPRDSVTFRNLRTPFSCHSGDIRHRVGACAEYIDVDIKKALAHNVHYVMIQVHNYDSNPLYKVKECVFGLMEREDAVAGEIFVPKTITNCMGIANEARSVNVALLDLKSRSYIWVDIECEGAMAMYEQTSGHAKDAIRALVYNKKMTVYELLSMHAERRGQQVPNSKEADLKLTWEDFATDYAKVASYMTF